MGGPEMGALESMAEWLGIDATLLGFILGILILVAIAIAVLWLTDSTFIALVCIFAVWIFIALPGVELWPTWTLTIGFLLLLVSVVYPNVAGRTETGR